MKGVLESFDFVYMPSTDVAEVGLGEDGPRLLLAEHLEGEAPVLVHRVDDLERAVAALEERGVEVGPRFEIPPGICAELRTPGGQRLAIYELTRPERVGSLPGRTDFQPADSTQP